MALRVYHDFVIFAYNLARDGRGDPAGFAVRVFHSPVGEGEEEEEVQIADYRDLKYRARQLESRRLDKDGQIALGSRLADLLLPPYARRMFQRSISWLEEDEGLRLRLRLPDVLSDLPWEFMYVQSERGEASASNFLALKPRLSIVRHEALAIPAEWFGALERRRVLVVMASPEPYQEYPRLDHLPQEQALIKEALTRAAGVDDHYVPEFGEEIGERIPSARIAEVAAALRANADILHFSGHGKFDGELDPTGEGLMGAGNIILATDDNQGVKVPADRLLELVRGHGVRLVVLGACETGRSDHVHVWSSVAISLLKGEIPAVLAMQHTVYDWLTAHFMGAFYEALAGGLAIDEALYLGRQAIRTQALTSENPDVRDWGSPILYLRAPGGRIFQPVGDEEQRALAQRRANGQYRVHRASYQWLERGEAASEDDLAALEEAREDLALAPTQALLLLRSAVARDRPVQPWLAELRGERGKQFVERLNRREAGRPSGPEEALSALGLEPAALAGRPPGIGALAWVAARHPNHFAGLTAGLALIASGPAPALAEMEQALATIKQGGARWRRRAALRGALADADEDVARLNAGRPLFDRLGAWLWRFWGRVYRSRFEIAAQTAGGALGAGLALGLWRGLIALIGRDLVSVIFNVYLYLGVVLGFFLALGMSLARPSLLPARRSAADAGRVARRALLLGTLIFGVGHYLLSELNGLDVTVRPWLPVGGLLAGAGLSLALYGQTATEDRPARAGRIGRLGLAALAGAAAQALLFAAGAAYEAMTVSYDAQYYWRFFRRYRAVERWMDQAGNWEPAVMVLDTALVAVVLAIGVALGLRAGRRWLRWWRGATADDERWR